MRDLTLVEMNEVSGGFWGGCGVSVGWGCGFTYGGYGCSPSYGYNAASSITAYAGTLVGTYNLAADIFNGASCSTIASAIKNIGTDTQIGYNAGKGMTISQANQFLQNAISSINSAVTTNCWGGITSMALVGFPPGQSNSFG